MLKIHDMACWGLDGIEMEEISTLLGLLPAARGCDDVASRRQPADASLRQPTDELPRRGEANNSDRICPKSKQGQFPADDPEDLQAAMAVVLSS